MVSWDDPLKEIMSPGTHTPCPLVIILHLNIHVCCPKFLKFALFLLPYKTVAVRLHKVLIYPTGKSYKNP